MVSMMRCRGGIVSRPFWCGVHRNQTGGSMTRPYNVYGKCFVSGGTQRCWMTDQHRWVVSPTGQCGYGHTFCRGRCGNAKCRSLYVSMIRCRGGIVSRPFWCGVHRNQTGGLITRPYSVYGKCFVSGGTQRCWSTDQPKSRHCPPGHPGCVRKSRKRGVSFGIVRPQRKNKPKTN